MPSVLVGADNKVLVDSSDPDNRKVLRGVDLPLPDLVCDSISASKNKCGFAPFTGQISPAVFYLTENSRFVDECCDCGPGVVRPCSSTDCDTTDAQTIWTINPGTCTPESDGGSDSCDGCAFGPRSFGAGYTTNEGPNPVTPPITGGTIVQNSLTGTFLKNTLITSSRCDGNIHNPYTEASRSNEYTTDTLISKTIADLPDYSGCWGCVDEDGGPCDMDAGQGCICSASYNLSEDESGFAIQNFKYKFIADEDDPPPEGMILRWVERFTPDVGDPSDTEKSFTFDGTASETGEYERTHPDSNGDISIAHIRWDEA